MLKSIKTNKKNRLQKKILKQFFLRIIFSLGIENKTKANQIVQRLQNETFYLKQI